MVRPPLSRLASWALVCALGCAGEDGAQPPPPWSFVPPDQSPGIALSAEQVAAAAERHLPALAAVQPADLDTTLDELAAALEPCGTGAYSDSGSRFWLGSVSCEQGGVEGFGYQFYGPFDPAYSEGMSGTYTYTLWSAEAWSEQLHVWGNAEWSVQQFALEDGTTGVYRWFEGDLHTDAAHRPSWFVGDVAPNAIQSWTELPDGSRFGYLAGSAVVEDPEIDALHVSELSAGPGCAQAAGTLSVRARGGSWYDLTLQSTDEGCLACGSVIDAHGTELGSACLDLDTVLEGGLP